MREEKVVASRREPIDATAEGATASERGEGVEVADERGEGGRLTANKDGSGSNSRRERHSTARTSTRV